MKRVAPFATVYGVPDWNVVIPATDHPPNGYFHQPARGPGIAHKYAIVSRCVRSKSLMPRSSLSPPMDIGTEVKFPPGDWLSTLPTPSLVLSSNFDQV